MSTARKRTKKAAGRTAVVRKSTRVRSSTCEPDQGAGIGDWFTGPSDEAKARVAEIRARWQRLQDWGVRQKLPNTRQQQASVEHFLTSWDRSPDVNNIGAVTADIVAIERYATEYDQRHGGNFRAVPISTTFDPDASSRLRAAAAATDIAAREVTAAAKEAAKDAQEAARPLLQEVSSSNVPLLFGVGAGLALGIIVIVIRSRPRVVGYV